MRAWWCVGLLGLACSPSAPLGAYRIPIQTGPDSVELHTMIVSLSGVDMILYDGEADRDYGTGRGELYSDVPYRFSVPQAYPLDLQVSQQYIQDEASRPYLTIALAPLSVQSQSITRVTLSSGADHQTIVTADENFFTESAEPQPANSQLPGPLFALSSVAGTGLWLPADIGTVTQWQDAMSTFAPPDPVKSHFCGAPLISSIQATPLVAVKVPAGTYQATQVREVISSCDPSQSASVLVFEMDRWYAPGVGPVKMTYQGSDSKTREYDLVGSQVSGNPQSLWPLANGNRWTYQIIGPDGTKSPSTVDVSVTDVKTITAPSQS